MSGTNSTTHIDCTKKINCGYCHNCNDFKPKQVSKFSGIDNNQTNSTTMDSKTATQLTAVAGSLGLIIGLGYAFTKEKGAWAYLGYGLLGSVVLSAAVGIPTTLLSK